MMTNFDQIRSEAKAKGKKKLVVAPVPAGMDFTALSDALAEGLVAPILIGSSDAAAPWVKSLGKRAEGLEFIEEPDALKALALGIEKLRKGEADILMRGSIDPGRFLAAVFFFVAAFALWFVLLGWAIHLWSCLNAALWKPR